VNPGEAMQVLAVLALGADATRKVEAKVRARHVVGPRVPRVLGDVASPLCLGLREVFVLAITAAPLVVPDVENGAGLRWRFALDQGGIDLGSRGALLSPNDLLDLLFCWGCDLGVGCGERELLVVVGSIASIELESLGSRVDLCNFRHADRLGLCFRAGLLSTYKAVFVVVVVRLETRDRWRAMDVDGVSVLKLMMFNAVQAGASKFPRDCSLTRFCLSVWAGSAGDLAGHMWKAVSHEAVHKWTVRQVFNVDIEMLIKITWRL
jgi:hypothetical protein